MTTTYTAKFHAPKWGENDGSKSVTNGEALDTLDAALADASPFAPDNSINLDSSGNLHGLTFGYLAGRIRSGNVVTIVAAGTLALAASATNYVEVATDGTVSTNASGFTSGRFPLFEVATNATDMTSVTDERCWLVVPGAPATGSLDTSYFADFDEDSASTTGLTWGYQAGRVRNDNATADVAAGTVTLTDAATNYVELTPAGAVVGNTSGFTSGRIPLRVVVTSGGAISSSTDKRAWISAGAGGAGGTGFSDFDEDSASTTGLTWGYLTGSLRNNNVITVVAAGTVTLTDAATNYVEVDSSGTVSVNQTGFTAGRIPIREIVAASGAISTSTDKRSVFQFSADFKSDGSVAMTGDFDAGGNEIRDYAEQTSAPSSSAGTLTIDCSAGSLAAVTLTENVTTLSFANVPASGSVYSLTMELTQDATGGWTVTWPASVTWPSGSAPTLSTGASAVDVITLYTRDGGTTWRAFAAGLGMA